MAVSQFSPLLPSTQDLQVTCLGRPDQSDPHPYYTEHWASRDSHFHGVTKDIMGILDPSLPPAVLTTIGLKVSKPASPRGNFERAIWSQDPSTSCLKQSHRL